MIQNNQIKRNKQINFGAINPHQSALRNADGNTAESDEDGMVKRTLNGAKSILGANLDCN